jgi:hypothetical protein
MRTREPRHQAAQMIVVPAARELVVVVGLDHWPGAAIG